MINKRLINITAAIIVVVTMVLPASVAWALTPNVVYDSIAAPLPPNVVSLGYEATSTSEFGDYIQFAGTNRNLTRVSVTMSAWGKHSEYPLMPAAGWRHPITLNIYAVDLSGSQPAVGALIASKTQTFKIPWRPEPDPTCATPTAWRARDGQCYNGFAFNIRFDLSSLHKVLPNQIIYGIVYNTADYGPAPIHQPGPYNSLNVGLNAKPPSVGTDVEPDALFWNTSFAGNYTDGGAGGVGIFRRDTNWAPYTPAVRFQAVEPHTDQNGDNNNDQNGDNSSQND